MSKLERNTPFIQSKIAGFPSTQDSTSSLITSNKVASADGSLQPEDFQQAHGFETRTSTPQSNGEIGSLPQAAQGNPRSSRINPLLRLQIHASSEGGDSALYREDPKMTTHGAAERLHKAFEGAGTNEKEIFRVLRDRTSEEIDMIVKDYSAKYDQSLDVMLQMELSGSDLRKVGVLLKGDKIPAGQRDAELLHIAMEGLGTDEKAILDTLYGTTKSERNDIQIAYHKLTGRTLGSDIRSEHSGKELLFAQAMLNRGTLTDADVLRAAMKGIGTDKEAIFLTLEGKSPEQLQEMQSQYKEFYQRELPKDLKKELRGSDEAKALALLEKGYISSADQLHIAMEGWGTDVKAVMGVFEGKSPEERAQTIQDFENKYGELEPRLKNELNKVQLAEVRSLIANGQLSLAETLNRYMRGLGSNEEGIIKALNGTNLNDLTEARSEYLEKYGRRLEDHIRSELSGKDLEKAEILLKNGAFSTLESLHYLLDEKKLNHKDLFQALAEVPSEERSTLDQDFTAKYGTSLSKTLRSKLRGANERKALYLMESGTLNLEQKLEVATVGVGTREDEVFDAIASATPEERQALASNEEWMGKLSKSLSSHDLERMSLLLEHGELTRTEQLHFAMAGRGTDKDLLFEALEDLSPEERVELQADYLADYGTNLLDDLRSELGKRDFWKAQDLLAPPPTSLREHVERVEDRMLRERDSGTPASNISDSVMDVFVSTGKHIDQEFRELRHVYKQAKKGVISSTDASEKVAEKEQSIDKLTQHYRAQKDSTAKTVSGIATMSVAAAASVATAGMATLPAAALVAASAGTTKVMTKHVLIGNSYDITGLQAAQDFVIGAGEGLATVAMGKAGDALYSTLGKQVLAAQGQDVSRKGLMALGRKALEESGQTVTQELLEKAMEDSLQKAGREFLKKTVVHKVAGSALTGAAKGAAFSGVKAATRTLADEETWSSEFSEAVLKILNETATSAGKGAKAWAVTLSALQLGSQVSGATMAKIKMGLGQRVVEAQELTFSRAELYEAGAKVLGKGASEVSEALVEAVGHEQLVLEVGSKYFEDNIAGQAAEIIAGNLVKRGTAAYTRNVIESLNKHEVWRDGVGEALEHLWRSSNTSAIKGTAQWGGKDVAIEFAKRAGVVGSGDPSEALLSSVLWRSLGATLNS